jgi:hypothetical protein
MLQTFSFDGTGRQIDAKASFMRYESGSAAGGNTAVRVTADSNDLGTYLPGDSIELPTDCKRWNVVPLDAACTGVLRLGLGRVQSARLVGQVSVIDAGAEKTNAGRQYWGITSYSDAANQSVLAIYANLQTVAIRRLTISSPTAGDVMIGASALIGTSHANVVTPRNKKSAGAAPVFQLRAGLAVPSTAPTGAEIPSWSLIGRRTLAAGIDMVLEFDKAPLLLTGGNLLNVIGLVANRQLNLMVDCEEL